MQPLSEAQEDYLKHIFKLSEDSDKMVSAITLAEHLSVKPSSVTSMLKKLGELGLINYVPYQGATLTDAGRLVALEVLRHHRLIELYLTEMLDFGWEEVHEQAERLEHVISEELEARMAEKLGHPTHDPHGDPIPTVDLKLPEGPDTTPLTRVKSGAAGEINRVRSQDRDLLNMLSRLNLTIGAGIKVQAQERSGVRVQVGDDQFLLPIDLASKIWITTQEES